MCTPISHYLHTTITPFPFHRYTPTPSWNNLHTIFTPPSHHFHTISTPSSHHPLHTIVIPYPRHLHTSSHYLRAAAIAADPWCYLERLVFESDFFVVSQCVWHDAWPSTPKLWSNELQPALEQGVQTPVLPASKLQNWRWTQFFPASQMKASVYDAMKTHKKRELWGNFRPFISFSVTVGPYPGTTTVNYIWNSY